MAAGVGVRLLDAPVNRRDDPRAHRYIVDHVHPGTTIRRRIAVTNNSEVRRRIAVYPAGADVGEDGFTFAPGRTENELASWTTVDRTDLDLDENDGSEVWVTIEVPKKASAGERYAVVWAEVAGGNDPQSNVRNVGRAGIRIYLSVGPGGEPPSDFEITGLTGRRIPGGTPEVIAEVRNTGQRALDLAGELTLSDGPGGLSVGPVKAEAATLALGGTTSVRVRLDRQLPDGPWTAELRVASGWTRRSAANTISFGQAIVPTRAGIKRQLLMGGVGVSAMVLATLLGYVYFRRARADRLTTAR